MMFLIEEARNLILGIVSTLMVTSANFLPVGSPLPTPTPSSDVIVRSGQYSYSGQTLKYTVNIPKNGGPVNGNFSGVCNGPITGTFNNASQSVTGQASVTCPVLLFRKLDATYIAHFDLKEGKAHIDWQGDLPYTSGQGSFVFNFEPVK